MVIDRTRASLIALATAALTAHAGCNALVTSRDLVGLCGDGEIQVEAGEQCDDGDTTAGDGCSASCTIEVCGNGIVDKGEACDLGGANDNSADCTLKCKKARCGDGYTKTRGKPPFEICDDGNTVNGDGCNPQCSLRGRVSVLDGIPDGMGVADGTGPAARFAGIYGLVSDGSNLYLSDHGACAIRRMKLDTGEVQTIAGSPGDCQFSKDGSGAKATFGRQQMPLALVGERLYVGERHLLRRVDLAQGKMQVDSCAQFTLASDEFITALASDPTDSSRLFVATRNGIYKVALPCTCDLYTGSNRCSFQLLAGGTATTDPVDAKGTAARFVNISTMVLAPDRKALYLGDTALLRELDLTTLEVKTRAGSKKIGHTDGVGSAARFYRIRGLAYAKVGGAPALLAAETSYQVSYADGTPVSSSYGWSNVRRIDPASWKVETIAGSHGAVEAGQTPETDGFGTHARFIELHAVAVVGSTLYLGENASVRAVSLTPPYQVTTAGGVLVQDFTHYEILAVASRAGHVYYGTRTGELYERPLLQAGPPRSIGICATSIGQSNLVEGIAVAGEQLFLLDAGIQGICRVDLQGKLGKPCCAGCKETCSVVFQQPGLQKSEYFKWRPMALAYDGTYLYFPDRWGERLLRVDPAKDPAKGYTALTGKGSLILPWGLTYLKPYLYVSSPLAGVITRVDPKTGATRTIGDGQRLTRDGEGNKASFCGPAGLATDGTSLFVGEGHCGLFTGEWHGHGVRQIELVGGVEKVTTLVGPGPKAHVVEGAGGRGGVNWPASITYDAATRALYIADSWDYALLKVD